MTKYTLIRFVLSLGFLSVLVFTPLKAENKKSIFDPLASPTKSCEFFPANNLRFPVRPYGHMSEMTFQRINQVVEQIYAPLMAQMGKPRLKVVSKWTDDNVNAFAMNCNDPNALGKPGYPVECNITRTTSSVFTPTSIVVMFGGMARHPLMTPEGFILVACHEVGHHIGGYPRYNQNTAWAATEGQSDYFATTKCARKVFAAIGQNIQWTRTQAIPLEVRVQCNASFPQSAEAAAICMRSAMGGLTLARVLQDAHKLDPRLIGFDKKDANVVTTTFERHPEAQCRLDTYYAGSVCQVSDQEPFSLTDARLGACHPARNLVRGSRPSCWFAGR